MPIIKVIQDNKAEFDRNFNVGDVYLEKGGAKWPGDFSEQTAKDIQSFLDSSTLKLLEAVRGEIDPIEDEESADQNVNYGEFGRIQGRNEQKIIFCSLLDAAISEVKKQTI